MEIQLERIDSEDNRATMALAHGEVVAHEVILRIDGQPREFHVYLRAKMLREFDASVVFGDELVEELLRFEPAALTALYAAVSAFRRGNAPTLPMTLLQSERDARPQVHPG